MGAEAPGQGSYRQEGSRSRVFGPFRVLRRWWSRVVSRNELRNTASDPLLQDILPSGEIPVSDVSDHLNELLFLALLARPRLIVELGTRGGESTRALLAGARHTGATMLSVDIDPCDEVALPEWADELWHFHQDDDVRFVESGDFAAWFHAHRRDDGDGPPVVDLLYIDTSHEYEHTRRELAVWTPFVRSGGFVVLHDTHMGDVYRRFDNSCGHGWPNARGVIRAVEDELGVPIREEALTTRATRDWIVRHQPWCSGLTVLVKRD